VRGAGDLGLVPLAQFGGDALGALVLLVVLGRMGYALPVRMDWAEVRGALRDGWPLVLHATLALLSFNADLIILRFFRDLATVGQYAVAYTLVSYLANLGGAFAVSVLPALSRGMGAQEDTPSVYHGALLYGVALALPCAVGGWILAPGIIALVFGPGYEPAGRALTILIWMVPAIWMRFVVQMALIGRARQDLVLKATVAGAIAAVGLDLLVIPRWGMMGAAVVSVTVEVLRFLMVLALGARAGVPSPRLPRAWRAVLASAVMGFAVHALLGRHVLVGVAAGAVTYALALVMLGGVIWRRGGLPLLKT
jgi:O-antigen/teichoic acid export membrane protein